MPNVHGIEFTDKQAELVEDLIRELLHDGDCAIYALHEIEPHGELRIAPTLPAPGPTRDARVFVRIRPGIHAPTIIRPVNTKFGDIFMKLETSTHAEILAIIRAWRRQLAPSSAPSSTLASANDVSARQPAHEMGLIIQLRRVPRFMTAPPSWEVPLLGRPGL